MPEKKTQRIVLAAIRASEEVFLLRVRALDPEEVRTALAGFPDYREAFEEFVFANADDERESDRATERDYDRTSADATQSFVDFKAGDTTEAALNASGDLEMDALVIHQAANLREALHALERLPLPKIIEKLEALASGQIVLPPPEVLLPQGDH